METAQDLRELWVLLHVVRFGGHRRIFVFRDLGLLKRDMKFQQRYDRWIEGIKAEYGSQGNRFPVFPIIAFLILDRKLCYKISTSVGKS